MSGIFLYVLLADGQEALCEMEEAATGQLSPIELNQVVSSFLESFEGEVVTWEILAPVDGRLRELQMMLRSWVPLELAWRYRMVPPPGFSEQ